MSTVKLMLHNLFSQLSVGSLPPVGDSVDGCLCDSLSHLDMNERSPLGDPWTFGDSQIILRLILSKTQSGVPSAYRLDFPSFLFILRSLVFLESLPKQTPYPRGLSG